MNFNYEGHDKLGQIVTGTVEAPSEEEAAKIIRADRGHYAREISTDEVKPKYDTPAVGGIAERPPAVEEADAAAEAAGETSGIFSTAAAARDTKTKDVKKEEEYSWNKALGADVERISDVLRQMKAWKTAYQKSLSAKDTDGKVISKGSSLPTGVPVVGGKTWECYDKHFDAITEHLFKKALERAMTKR